LVLPITAIVLALAPGCPIVTLIGAGLGALALARLRRSGADNARATLARRLSIGAMAGGAITTIFWMSAIERFAATVDAAHHEAVSQRSVELLAAAEAGDVDAARATWLGVATAPTAAEIRAFGAACAARYGAVQDVAVLSATRTGSALGSTFEAAVVLRFERESITGLVRYRIFVGLGSPMVDCRITGVTIDDSDRGPMELVTAAAAPGGEG
jgi:hypothetical protein